MREKRHTSPKAISSLESLDGRVLLSAASVAHVVHHAPAAIHVSSQHHQANGSAAANRPAIAVPAFVGGGPSLAAMNFAIAAPAPTSSGPSPVLPRPVSPPSLAAPTPTPIPTPTDIQNIKNGVLAKAGQYLYEVYQEFAQSGNSGNFQSPLSNMIEISGSMVGVKVHTPDTNALSSTLTSVGMVIQATDPNSGTIQGLLPIAQLPTVAQIPVVTSITPVFLPKLSGMASL